MESVFFFSPRALSMDDVRAVAPGGAGVTESVIVPGWRVTMDRSLVGLYPTDTARLERERKWASEGCTPEALARLGTRPCGFEMSLLSGDSSPAYELARRLAALLGAFYRTHHVFDPAGVDLSMQELEGLMRTHEEVLARMVREAGLTGPLVRDDYAWSSRIDVAFAGKQLALHLLPESRLALPSRAQLDAVSRIRSFAPGFLEGAASLLAAHVAEYELPRAPGVSEIRFTHVLVETDGSRVSLSGECPWDVEHGVELVIEGDAFVACRRPGES